MTHPLFVAIEKYAKEQLMPEFSDVTEKTRTLFLNSFLMDVGHFNKIDNIFPSQLYDDDYCNIILAELDLTVPLDNRTINFYNNKIRAIKCIGNV